MSDIRMEAIYRASPAEVWQALTDPEELSDWLMKTDFVCEVGREFRFWTKPAPGFDGVVTCRVLEAVKDQRLSYTWNGGGQNTVVTWQIEPFGASTRLILTQTGFTGLNGTFTRLVLGRGWARILRRSLRKRIEKSNGPG